MSEAVPVGFSQRIRLEWLERTAQLARAGLQERGIVQALRDELREQVSIGGDAERSNREKAITILTKIWGRPPRELKAFRDDGLRHLDTLPLDRHLSVHWGMTIAVYPFVAVVAEVAGRLASLQGTVSAAQLQRRVREQLGERETVARAARRVLRSFIDWDVLDETGRTGVYRPAALRVVEDRALSAWLVEAAMRASGGDPLPLARASKLRALFPFALPDLNAAEVAADPRLELFRQGLDADMIILRK